MAASTGMMAASLARGNDEHVLQGDLDNPMTREVMEPSNGWGPATQLLGEAIQIAYGGTQPRVLFMHCLLSVISIKVIALINSQEIGIRFNSTRQ